MFDIGWSEILIVAVVAILVVGPKELPGLLRTVGKTVGNLRRLAGDFQNQFNEALREAELEDVKTTIGDIKSLDPRVAVKDAVSKQLTDITSATDDVSKSIQQSTDEINSSLNENAEPEAVEPVLDTGHAEDTAIGTDENKKPVEGEEPSEDETQKAEK
ncbi:Sec-independent protein translocase protein TatB [uncultured Cohaesibacter sp.]|uniref:Sec-independent protein translocase protein TatB n=1 Tax=uncultured Cohaesibacter sp. TaxID=1002546 RepID=UPI0029304A4F|nr:Sec-independent protein translocase protein TatB [uncultured Cohaesibacter sp.]